MPRIDEDQVPSAPASRRARDTYDDERRPSGRPVRVSDAEIRALELATSAAAGVNALQEDLAEFRSETRAALGRAPSPGHEGSGLIGAVSEMQAVLARLDTPPERRGPSRARSLARAPVVVALIAALGGGAGIAGIVEAARGRHAAAEERPRGP
ncbi:hypothetical protein [Sorangium sp. So ce362]|uniref:hypothetical protein n=1 Tax=Sorangium sp. So ce362 TaxID=3133303 RepID=UPI003F6280B9